MFGDIGGLASSVYTAGQITISFITSRILFWSILKKIYQVKTYDDNDEQDYEDKKRNKKSAYTRTNTDI